MESEKIIRKILLKKLINNNNAEGFKKFEKISNTLFFDSSIQDSIENKRIKSIATNDGTFTLLYNTIIDTLETLVKKALLLEDGFEIVAGEILSTISSNPVEKNNMIDFAICIPYKIKKKESSHMITTPKFTMGANEEDLKNGFTKKH